MSRVAWSFAGVTWPINPDTDSGWSSEHTFAEHVPIASPRSFIQWTGMRSSRRSISGWIYGSQGASFKAQLEQWYRQRTRAQLVDHTGTSRFAFFASLSFTAVQDASSWRVGRTTWRYNAELIALDD
jgi:hypothetical protein